MTTTTDRELLIYAGRRDNNGKQTHAWHDPRTGNLAYFGKIIGTAIGGQYAVTVTREDGQIKSAIHDVAFEGSALETGLGSLDEEQIAIWEAEDRESVRARQRKQAETRLARNGSLDRAMEPLLDVVRSAAKNRHDLRAITNAVLDRLTEEYYKAH